MTKEEKDLLLKDLCGRLPYGLKVLCLKDFNHDWYNLKMVDIEDNEVYLTGVEPYTNRYVETEAVRPYLFPLSSMTPKQRDSYRFLTSSGHASPTGLIEFFHKHHIDYRGLIPKGLANDATDLNIY